MLLALYVSRDDPFPLHAFMWLKRPILEPQARPHLVGGTELSSIAFFLLWSSSASLEPSLILALQVGLSWAMASQLLGSTWRCFMSRLQTSTYLSFGRPAGLCPEASDPYRMSCGNRPSGMRFTCLSQLRRLLLRVMRMSWHPVL